MLTVQQARQEIAKNDAEIVKLEQAILDLRNKNASLYRIVNGDHLHDAHNEEVMRQALERRQYMDWYYSDEQKKLRAAEERAQDEELKARSETRKQQKLTLFDQQDKEARRNSIR